MLWSFAELQNVVFFSFIFFLQYAPNALNFVGSSTCSRGRSFRHTANLFGWIVTPAFPLSEGCSAPFGSEISKRCIIDEKNRKSSILARTSPRHIRRPTPKGKKNGGIWTFPSLLMNRLGRKTSGSSQSFGSMWTLLMSGTTCEPAGIL